MENRSTTTPGIVAASLLLLVALPASLAAQAAVNSPTAPNGGGLSGGPGGAQLWAVIGEPMAAVTASAPGSMNTDDLFIGSIVTLYPESDLSEVEEHRVGGAMGGTVSLTAAPTTVSEEVTFTLTLPRAGSVRLAVYDMLGRIVAVPVESTHQEGVFTVRWHPDELPAGAYIARLTVDGVEGATLPLQFVH